VKKTPTLFGLFIGGALVAASLLLVVVTQENPDSSLEMSTEQSSVLDALTSRAGADYSHRPLREKTYAWAVEIKEGERTSFQGLSVTLVSVEEKNPCERNCLRANLLLASGGASDEFFGEVGDVFSFGGTVVKLSQLAPLEAPEGVLRRAVLLFSPTEE
jgi:hypothetical protein